MTYWLAKRIVKIHFISLPNLLGNELVKEFIQLDCHIGGFKKLTYNRHNALKYWVAKLEKIDNINILPDAT
ncbi:hypothetical protein [Arsenophonus endosymbiont of Aleurodicus dispersus]|uniref:hypothetical protein n=1 Tax=Arsenophonus endosymbiont of Aleurodicus dispersus TaxID=235559 RepID=UPI003F75A33C